ncbi:hypothetical protein [Microbacterium sp. 179-I 3D3 NHS]
MSDPKNPSEAEDEASATGSGAESPEEGAEAEQAAEDAVIDGDD